MTNKNGTLLIYKHENFTNRKTNLTINIHCEKVK